MTLNLTAIQIPGLPELSQQTNRDQAITKLWNTLLILQLPEEGTFAIS